MAPEYKPWYKQPKCAYEYWKVQGLYSGFYGIQEKNAFLLQDFAPVNTTLPELAE